MSKHIILTVGTNPLPVYVATYHLLAKFKDVTQLTFISSEQTEIYKNNVMELIDKKKILPENVRIENIIIKDSGNPNEIISTIRDSINLNTDEELHLNYTGGTKAISVHTWEAVKDISNTKSINISASYLNPRSGDGPNIINNRGISFIDDTRKGLMLDINDLLLLHNYEPITENNPPAPIPNKQKLTGPELESKTYYSLKKALEEISDSNQIRNNFSVYHSIKPIKPTVIPEYQKNFELDVVSLLGHQLLVVSCTIGKKEDTIKKKAMEVMLRAKQIGGDEARTIVLCGAEPLNAKRVQEEVFVDAGRSIDDSLISVWGLDKWEQLKDNFKDYLTNNLAWS